MIPSITPSAVGLGDDGAILVGLAARERLPTHPAVTTTAFKRYMGTDRLIFLGDKGYRAEELSALVLRTGDGTVVSSEEPYVIRYSEPARHRICAAAVAAARRRP